MGIANREEVKSKVENLVKVSTIPAVLSRVMAVVEDEEGTASDLKKVIETDQAIASRVVSIANSAFYGLTGTVSNLSQAILVLGFGTVRSIAISITVFEAIGKNSKFDLSELWVHSMKVAIASSLIAAKTRCVDKDSALLAGLMHDIGRAVLLQLYKEVYVEVSMPGADGLLEREEEIFGANHCETGAWLAEIFQLPDACVKSIKYHHQPGECPVEESSPLLFNLLPVVYLADYIVSQGQTVFANDCQPSASPFVIMSSLELEMETFLEIKEKIEGMDEEVRRFFRA